MTKKDQAVEKMIQEIQYSVVWLRGHTITLDDARCIRDELNNVLRVIAQQVDKAEKKE